MLTRMFRKPAAPEVEEHLTEKQLMERAAQYWLDDLLAEIGMDEAFADFMEGKPSFSTYLPYCDNQTFGDLVDETFEQYIEA
jgi:hypothetical protein